MALPEFMAEDRHQWRRRGRRRAGRGLRSRSAVTFDEVAAQGDASAHHRKEVRGYYRDVDWICFGVLRRHHGAERVHGRDSLKRRCTVTQVVEVRAGEGK